ncbi:hypothetical protein Bamb_3368 [Burkholderia ambifaria AMMD]|uniref:Uncharacterized protein n=1 Tax=Burkholderia ambifaria (strain ATCC BAA-244 / DSM 16087 / CCUG 44356 / LMG 19182 / AMMD) TaxID=339670 RepID=Q0BAA1_BURCM|nr:hypothetical protein Bamb_3368 [Burkholderia ambifaria AMMD]
MRWLPDAVAMKPALTCRLCAASGTKIARAIAVVDAGSVMSTKRHVSAAALSSADEMRVPDGRTGPPAAPFRCPASWAPNACFPLASRADDCSAQRGDVLGRATK